MAHPIGAMAPCQRGGLFVLSAIFFEAEGLPEIIKQSQYDNKKTLLQLLTDSPDADLFYQELQKGLQ
ncbi:MAG: hypothetical protein WAL90_16015 [Desulfobacterales bacterium]